MTMTSDDTGRQPGTASSGGGARPATLSDTIDSILDKGLVIDAYIRINVVGIELLTIDARIVVASIDTYLHFAQLANRLELGGGESNERRGLPETLARMGEEGARSKTRGLIRGVEEEAKERISGEGEERPRPARAVAKAAREAKETWDAVTDAARGGGADRKEEGPASQEGKAASGSPADAGREAPHQPDPGRPPDRAAPAERRSPRRAPGRRA